jgi:anti-anti-sigma regulatory factor
MADTHMRSRADRRDSSETPPTHPALERRSADLRELRLRVERRTDKHVVVYIGNEFIAPNYCLLDETLERLLPRGPGLRVELEISDVPYADSEALGRLVVWSRKFAQAGSVFVLLNPTPYVRGIMESVHLDEAVTIVDRHVTPPPQP